MTPSVAVVIPAIPERVGGMLDRAVESVINQTIRVDQLIVKVDREGVGAAATRTAGLMDTTTEWVAFLDDDDYFKPIHLEHLLVKALETGADLVFPWFDVIGGTDPFPQQFGQEWDPEHPTQTTITFLVRREAAIAVGGFVDPSDYFTLHPEADPGTDEFGHRAGEEFRFIKRLSAAGYKIVHLAERTWCWEHWSGNTMGMPSRRAVPVQLR